MTDFKIGDKVLCIPHSYSGAGLLRSAVAVVVKEYKNGNVRIDIDDYQYSASGGQQAGVKWTGHRIVMATDERLSERSKVRAEHRAMLNVKTILQHLSKRTDYEDILSKLESAGLTK